MYDIQLVSDRGPWEYLVKNAKGRTKLLKPFRVPYEKVDFCEDGSDDTTLRQIIAGPIAMGDVPGVEFTLKRRGRPPKAKSE